MKGEDFPSSPQEGHSVKSRTRSGPGALFDVHIIVDWSARNAPSPARPSKDAIWWAVAQDGVVGDPEYARTRKDALDRLSARIEAALAGGLKVLVGFDFPFGYPEGVAERVCGKADALALWHWISEHICDGPDNANNRFDVASEINKAYDGIGPMWGRPATWDVPEVPITATERFGDHPPERRIVEAVVPRAKTVWQMAYAGSVGSQVLVGVPAVKTLRERFDEQAQIWPFETGLKAPNADLVLAEIYPSLLADRIASEQRDDEILDAAQVRVNAQAYHDLDRSGGLANLFYAAHGLSEKDRQTIVTEEAWILGAGHEATLLAASPEKLTPTPQIQELRYERDPAAIYRQSFEIVKREARLQRFPDNLQPVITRLIHACGMVEIADRIDYAPDFVAQADTSLRSGAPILCDCEMVRSGIITRNLSKDNQIIVTLNDPSVPDLAKRIRNTRSAAAVELWRDHIEGAIVVIGNAPTALFHLLELLDRGWPKPAAILGFPVGFVGAAESKAALAANPRGVPYIALKGRKGGSAIASAAVNALVAGLEGHG